MTDRASAPQYSSRAARCAVCGVIIRKASLRNRKCFITKNFVCIAEIAILPVRNTRSKAGRSIVPDAQIAVCVSKIVSAARWSCPEKQ